MGAQQNDIALWALGEHGPVSVEGKRLAHPVPGGYTAPAEYEVHYTYADGVRHKCVSTPASTIFGDAIKPKDGQPPRRRTEGHGIRFEGADGWLWVTRGKIEASRPEILHDKFADNETRLEVSTDHMKNFFDCVKSRKQPLCSAEVGHRSATVCHVGGIAVRLGRKLTWDPAREEFVGDAEANGHLAREPHKPWSYDAV